MRFVAGDLRTQLLHGGEAPLAADTIEQLHAQPPAVEVARKVEQVCLQPPLGPAHGGVAAQVRHGVVGAAADPHARAVDPVLELQVARHVEVGRREAQLAPQPAAAADHPLDHPPRPHILSVS